MQRLPTHIDGSNASGCQYHGLFLRVRTDIPQERAFSSASLVQPDILVLDEVLSVGDGAFAVKSAAKCLNFFVFNIVIHNPFLKFGVL